MKVNLEKGEKMKLNKEIVVKMLKRLWYILVYWLATIGVLAMYVLVRGSLDPVFKTELLQALAVVKW
jgi:hypothetical protein